MALGDGRTGAARLQQMIETLAQEQTNLIGSEAQDHQSGSGLRLFRGTVVAVSADNKLQIRRATSVDVDANGNQILGPADPAFYPQASPGLLAKVGDEVFGTEVAGKPVIMGVVAGAGYRDLSALASGNIDNYSLVNVKLANSSIDSRTLGPAAVLGSNVASRTIQGSNNLILRSVLTGEIGLGAVQSGEIMTRGIIGSNVGIDQLTSTHIQSQSIGNTSLMDNTVSSRLMGTASVYSDAIQTYEVIERTIAVDSVGNSRLKSRTILTDNIGHDQVKSGEIDEQNILHSHMTYDSVGNAAIVDGTVRTYELSSTVNNSLHNHSTLDFQSDYTVEQRLAAITKALKAKDLLARLEDADPDKPLNAGDAKVILGLVLEVWSMNADDQHYTAEEREAKLKSDPEFRHEYFMKYQDGYAEAIARESGAVSPNHLIRHAHAGNGHNVVNSVQEAHQAYDPHFVVTQSWLDDRLQRLDPLLAEPRFSADTYYPSQEELDVLTREDMLNKDQKAHLDNGGIFKLEVEGRFDRKCRKLDDGSYVVYSLSDQSSMEAAFQRALPMAALEAWKQDVDHDATTILTGDGEPSSLADFTPRQIREELSSGGRFTMMSVGEDCWCMQRTPDGAYIVYSPDRATFDDAFATMANYGPAWRWVAVHEDQIS